MRVGGLERSLLVPRAIGYQVAEAGTLVTRKVLETGL